MNASIEDVSTIDETLAPGLRFDVKIEWRPEEAPIAVTGWLASENGKIIAPLMDWLNGTSIISRLQALGTKRTERSTQSIIWKLATTLDNRAIQYIHQARNNNSLGDVNFWLHINVSYVTSSVVISGLRVSSSSQVSNSQQQVYYEYSREDFNSATNDMWVLSGNSGPTYLSVNTWQTEEHTRISSSEWLMNFAPKLGLGKFMIVEIPELSNAVLEQTLNKALDELVHAKDALTNLESKYLVTALVSIRNAITNSLLTLSSEPNPNGNRERRLAEELKSNIMSNVSSNSMPIYTQVLTGVERSLRILLGDCINKYIHEETSKVLETPTREVVEYAYLSTLNAVKFLSSIVVNKP